MSPSGREVTSGHIATSFLREVNTFSLTKVILSLVLCCICSFSVGYPSSPYTLRPFSEPEIAARLAERVRLRQFNKHISSIRIRVEHAFGKLKGCFPSLKALGANQDIHEIYRAVQAMMVLHNLCIDWGDSPEEIPFFDPDTAEDDAQPLNVDLTDYTAPAVGDPNVPLWETDDWLKHAGQQMREDSMDDLFPEWEV